MAPYIHTHHFRIAMSEVDVAQIHFTALFRWIDRGVSEWLAATGHSFTDLLREGPGIPIVDAHAQFHQRILLDDELTLHSWVSSIGNSSFRTRHWFVRDGVLAAEGELVHVCVDRETRATLSVPDWLRDLATDDAWRPTL
jgi:YbgC/YbaW family acyl-CoA thioester hydrolase